MKKDNTVYLQQGFSGYFYKVRDDKCTIDESNCTVEIPNFVDGERINRQEYMNASNSN